MAASGPRYPGTTASLANAGSSENANAWTSPANVGADDGVEASITAATYDSPDISELLVASNFGFTIPAGATIDGITVEIDRRDQAIGAASDNRVQLATGTTFADLVGTNKAATTTDWPTASAVATYGGAADTWSAGLTAAQVNSSGFAVMLSVQADAANTDIFVDFIRVTINYTEVFSGTIASTFSFSGSLTAEEVLSGTIDSSFPFSGSITGEMAETITGTIASSFPFSGSVTASEEFTGTTESTFSFSGSVTAEEVLTGSVASSFSFSGELTGDTASGATFDGAIASSFPFSGALTVEEVFTGATASSFGFSGSLDVLHVQTITGEIAISFGFSAMLRADNAPPFGGDALDNLSPRSRYPWYGRGLKRVG